MAELRAHRSVWRLHVRLLAALGLSILLLFWRDVADLVQLWWTSSTFSHCLFIPFIIAWLVQQRQDMLRPLSPVFWAPGLLILLGGNLLWLVGDAAGVGMLRHFALVAMGQGAVIALLGPQVARALAFPLFYALFMVPFGAEIVPPLQLVTADMSIRLLDLVGVPAHIEGIFITIPNGYFEVAEACSGAKFVIAMAAYGVLVCNVCFRSWWRRLIFLVGALLTCVLANGVRAFATIYVAYKSSADAAVGFDHILFGWLFFALVMIAVMAVAWPFFDRKPGDAFAPVRPWPLDGWGRQDNVSLFIALSVLALGIAPVWSTLSAGRGATLPRLGVPQLAGWQRTWQPMAYPWKAHFAGADYVVQARLKNGRGQVVDVAIATFARQGEGRELVGFGQGAVDPDSEWVWSSPARAPAAARGEEITAPGPVVRHVVSFYRVGDVLTGSANAVKLATLKARLLLRDQRAAAILISAEESERAPADAAIAAFLADMGDPQRWADAALGKR